MTTYAYDELNRLLTKTPDASLGETAVTYDYTVSGQCAAMQDASGETTYSYDARDRLIKKGTPQGPLTYTYNDAGQLLNIQSCHTEGVDLNYS